MRGCSLRRAVIAACAAGLVGCLPPAIAPDASSGDGSAFPPEPDAAPPRDAAGPGPIDAGPGVPADGATPRPDGSTELDASPPDASQPDASAPDASESDAAVPDSGPSSTCVMPDLVVELPDGPHAASYRTMNVTEDDCELYEGCVGGQGERALLELSFRLGNVGGEAIELGRPFENPLYYPSFCQDSYVIDGFFAAELFDENGARVASGRLSTSCIAGEDGSYSCRAQGLGAGDSSEQPIGRCDFLDVTAVPAGRYLLRVTANADRALTECDYDNDSAEVEIDYAPCDGTVCDGVCCPAGVACVQGVCMLPDLRISQESAAGSLFVTHRTFEDTSCEIAEMCVGGSGRRRLLEFEGRIENWGPGDLAPGSEIDNPLFEFSECHQHYHFRDFTDYRLLNPDGSVAAQGHKQSFCLASMVQVEGAPEPGPIGVRPPPGDSGCNLLLAGWADIYGVGTDCQWVDITDVPAGDYVLELTVNPLGRVAETDTGNNSVQIPVTISEDVPCDPQPEVCGDNVDQDCDDEPDVYDPDCQLCYPGDPFCEQVTPVTGNDSCAQAYELESQGTFEAILGSADAGEIEPACGGAGGDVFFTFSLDSEQVVYLGTLGSQSDTVLALYRSDCDGEPLRCEDEACGMDSAQLVQRLPAGQYLVAVKAKRAGEGGAVRLKFQHADAPGAIVLDRAGVYAGDTSGSDDSVQAMCPFYVPPTGSGDGGVPTVEECTAVAAEQARDRVSAECQQCACELDPLATVACGAECWALIDCVVDQCGGNGGDLGCIVQQCGAVLGEAAAAQALGPVLRMCPDSCPLGGGLDGGIAGSGVSGGGTAGMVGTAGSSGPVIGVGGMPVPAGGMGGFGGGPVLGGVGGFPGDGGFPTDSPVGSGGRDDVYVFASCQSSVIVSTCGTSAFRSVIDVRSGSLDAPVQTCSVESGYCNSDPNGAVVSTYLPTGLTFVVVDGRSESEAGAYQMSVIY